MRALPVLLLALCPTAQGFAADPALAAVFQRLDQAAATFKGITADIKRVIHQDIIPESDTVELGKLAFRKPKPHDIQYLLTLHQVEPPPPKDEVVEINNSKIQIYHPAVNEVDYGDLGKQFRNHAEQFLALGFGTTSQELQSNYQVTLGDPEVVEGQKTLRLDLVPKSEEVLKMYRKISIWVSDSTGVAVRHKLYQPGMKDYQIATYTNVKLRNNLPDSEVKLNLPKNVRREPLNH